MSYGQPVCLNIQQIFACVRIPPYIYIMDYLEMGRSDILCRVTNTSLDMNIKKINEKWWVPEMCDAMDPVTLWKLSPMEKGRNQSLGTWLRYHNCANYDEHMESKLFSCRFVRLACSPSIMTSYVCTHETNHAQNFFRTLEGFHCHVHVHAKLEAKFTNEISLHIAT